MRTSSDHTVHPPDRGVERGANVLNPGTGAGEITLPFPDTLSLPASARPIERQMGRGRDWLLHRVLLVADVFGLSLAFVLGQLLFEPGGGARDIVSPGIESAIFVLSLPVWVAIAVLSGLYGRDHTRTDHSTVDDLVGVFAVVTIGVWIFSCVIWFTQAASQNTPRMIAFWMMAVAFVVAARAIGRTIARRSRLYTQHAIMVGAGDVGQLIARKVKQHPEYGIELVGFVDSQPRERRRDIGDLRLLGGIDDLPAARRQVRCRPCDHRLLARPPRTPPRDHPPPQGTLDPHRPRAQIVRGGRHARADALRRSAAAYRPAAGPAVTVGALCQARAST